MRELAREERSKISCRTVALVGACLFAVTAFFLATSQSGRTVIYVVPKEFSGPIWIVRDRSAAEIPIVGGEYRIEVPRSGYVYAKDLSFSERWNVVKAVQGGTDISPEPDPPATGVALILGGFATNGATDDPAHKEWISAFVGTKEQAYDQGGLDMSPKEWQARFPR